MHDEQRRKDVGAGLRTPMLLAKWPSIGLLMFILGSLMFGGLAYNLAVHGPLIALDQILANTFPAIGLHSPAFVKPLIDSGFYIGKEVIILVDALLIIYFLLKRYWQELAMVTIGAAGASFLFELLSQIIARPRPATQIWILVNSPGFPSGHAINVVVCYGLLAYLLAPKMPTQFWKAMVIAAALLIIGFVGFSRIFTGGHYLTDILAGYAVGIAWSGLAYTLIEMYFQKRRSQNVKKE
jgi:undecaprenyl-diphosphatase